MIDKSKQFIILITTLCVQIICKSPDSNVSSLFDTEFLSNSDQSFLTSDSSNVTAVFITCCGRYDYMVKALTGFAQFNDFPVRQVILANDGRITKQLLTNLTLLPPLTLLSTGQKIGQISTIDQAYKLVKTPYVYFSEDDMVMVMNGIIAMNIQKLQADPKLLQVRNSHGFNTDYPVQGNYIDPKWDFSGFSFHPTVNRMDQYHNIQGGYTGLTNNRSFGMGAGGQENTINNHYRFSQYGWRCWQSPWQSIRHIGQKSNPKFQNQEKKIQRKDNDLLMKKQLKILIKENNELKFRIAQFQQYVQIQKLVQAAALNKFNDQLNAKIASFQLVIKKKDQQLAVIPNYSAKIEQLQSKIKQDKISEELLIKQNDILKQKNQKTYSIITNNEQQISRFKRLALQKCSSQGLLVGQYNKSDIQKISQRVSPYCFIIISLLALTVIIQTIFICKIQYQTKAAIREQQAKFQQTTNQENEKKATMMQQQHNIKDEILLVNWFDE